MAAHPQWSKSEDHGSVPLLTSAWILPDTDEQPKKRAGAVLARWSKQPRLLLNLTLFDRQPLHPAVERMIADFTNVLLLDLCGEGAAFDALAQRNQATFADAANSLKAQGAALVVLDCMGYHQQHRIGLQQRLGVPVLLSNQLVARLAAELLP
jgi:hypothetical protein